MASLPIPNTMSVASTGNHFPLVRLTHAETDESGNQLATGGTNPLPVSATPAAAGTGAQGLSVFRAPTSAPLTNVAQAIKASGGNVFGVRIQSPSGNILPTYIKFFNVAAASVVVGTTVPVMVLEVPAFDDPNTGQLLIVPGPTPIHNFATAISAIATSVLSDTGTQTAPTTGVIAEIHYA